MQLLSQLLCNKICSVQHKLPVRAASLDCTGFIFETDVAAVRLFETSRILNCRYFSNFIECEISKIVYPESYFIYNFTFQHFIL